MSKKGIIVYDFETNGFWSPLNQPIQVCCKVYEENECILTYTRYIKCKYPLNGLITSLTGITDDVLQNEGISLELAFFELKGIFERFSGYTIVGHNILRFDNRFFNYYMQYFRHGIQIKNADCFDTMCHHRAVELIGDRFSGEGAIGDWHWEYCEKRVAGCKLQEVGDFWKLSVDGALHNAESDVELTYLVYLKQISAKNMTKVLKKKVEETRLTEKKPIVEVQKEIKALVHSKIKKGYQYPESVLKQINPKQ